MTSFNVSALPLDRNQMIEASAGTGKTYTITNLCLRLLLGRGQPALAINEILVLTFTIAATDELKHRVASRIRAARVAFQSGEGDEFLCQLVAESKDPGRDQKLLAAAGQMMDEASIFTIHGFCTRVLGEQAFESGMLFNQDLNAERDDLLQAAAEDYFRAHILPLEANLRAYALSCWSTPARLAAGLKPFLFRGEVHYHPAEALDLNPMALIDKATAAKEGWTSGDLGAVLREADLHGRRTPMLRLNQMQAFCEKPGADLGDELWQIYASENLTKSVKKGNEAPKHQVIDLIDEVAAAIPLLNAWLWHKAISTVAALIDSEKERFSRMTLDDLLTRTAEAVNRPDARLAQTIAERWPVAMIDEFQDTDSTQHAIFSRVYAGDSTLLMIGDPKQAIYNFRGADVFTYINARRETSDIHSLGTNWRSSPAMVEATNYLFNKPGIFGSETDMPFHAVDAAPPNESMQITKDGKPCTPYQLFTTGEPLAFTSVTELRQQTMNYAAEETVRLISDKTTCLDGAPIEAGQIAFLVRSRRDAIAARTALDRRGIKSAYLTSESVFLEQTAGDLKLILEAVLEPKNDRAIRSALATRLVQAHANEINNLNNDIRLQQQVLEEFTHYHDTWRDQGIAPMVNALTQKRRLAAKWLCQSDGDRELTNLRHLAEILQHRALVAPGMFHLLKWFSQEQIDAQAQSSEERQLRLESDENLVKIVTMHAAKGLEYDIVMIPMPVFAAISTKGPVLFHEEHNDRFVTALELGQDAAHKQQNAAEERAEEFRLLYVALTRARFRCYLGAPKTNTFSKSAFAELLGLAGLEKGDNLPALITEKLPEDLFEITDGNATGDASYLPATDQTDLVAPPSRPAIRQQWRIHSYTSVVSRLAQDEAPIAVTGFQDDDRHEEDAASRPVMNRYAFPRGPRIGVGLHSLMEDIDFIEDSGHAELCRRTLTRLGLDHAWLPTLTEWLGDILSTPLGPCALSDVAGADRLDEMEFHFPVASMPDLVPFLIESGYLATGDTSELRLQGFLTGLIDLTFRFNNRYYIVDYKSNYLGYEQAYSTEDVTAAMDHHQYHLQYLLYTLALHRMLKQRLPDYDFDEHIGGVRYLFLRGMNGRDSTGVFESRPEKVTVERLDELLGGTQ